MQDGSDTGRLETFADGVMAIAITLLVLEIDVPQAGSEGPLAHALADQWPSYAAYVVSFMTIGIMWVNHHHMFRLIASADHTFLMLNVVFLMAIAVLPWPTALVAAHIRDGDGRMVAALVYGGTMTTIAVMFNVVWHYASKGRRLLVTGINVATLRDINRAYRLGPIFYLAFTLGALLSAWISLAGFAALAAYYMLPTSGPRHERLVDGS